jgi:hypothetical protein
MQGSAKGKAKGKARKHRRVQIVAEAGSLSESRDGSQSINSERW